MIVRSTLINVTNMTRVDEKREASSGRQFVVRTFFKKLNNFLTALERVRQMISAEEFQRRYAHSKSKLFDRDETFLQSMITKKTKHASNQQEMWSVHCMLPRNAGDTT